MRRVVAIVGALALLLSLAGMSLATVPTTSPYDWQGNGYPNASCDADSTTALWIWTGDSPLSLTINGHEQTGSWTQMGNGSWHFTITIDEFNYPPITASITYTGMVGTLTLSHCDDVVQPSVAPSSSVAPSVAPSSSVAPSVALEITPTPAPSSSVEAATGTPRVTPPPTDMIGSDQPTPSNTGWRIVLIGLAALALSVLAFAKPWRSSRRR